MPGLCGIVDRAVTGAQPVDALAAALVRYPWHSAARAALPGAAFGHVAVDGEGASRGPAFARAGHLALVFDGELYRAEATGETDAERVARGVVAEGQAFFRRVHGCFACAIWDEHAKTLTLVNDRFGMRPCYWAHHAGRFVFASEIAAVTADPGVPAQASERGLAEFLAFGQFLGDRTLHDHVHALPAAAWLTFDDRADRVTIGHYAALDADETPRTDAEWLEAIDEAFCASVAESCRGGGQLGLSLSGGLDARSILAVAPGGVSLPCVSLGVPGSIDLRAAAALARMAGQPFHAHHLDGDFLGRFEPLLREMVQLTDGHYLDQGIVLTTLPSYRELGINTLLRGHAGELMHMSKAYAFSLDAPGLAVRSHADLVDWLWAHLTDYMIGSVDPAAFGSPFGSRLKDLARASLEEQVAAWQHVEPAPQRIWRLFVAERLRRETSMSLQMFRSFVDVRVPFLEPTLVALLLGAPPHLKVGDTLQTFILRKHRPAFARVVNANTGAPVGAPSWRARAETLRMKVLAKLGVKGYQPYERLGLWLARDLQPLLRGRLLDPASPATAVFGVASVERVIDEHRRREKNHTFLLMALLILALRQQGDGRRSPTQVAEQVGAS